MIFRSLKQIKNNPLNSLFLIMGYTLAIFVLSLGISKINQYKKILNDFQKEPNKKIVQVNLSKEIKFESLYKVLKLVSENSNIEITDLGVTIGSGKQAIHWVCSAVFYSKSYVSNKPILDGRDLYTEETINSENILALGRWYSSHIFQKDIDKFIKINGETYKVIGVFGEENRESAWDNTLIIPMNSIPKELKDRISEGKQINIKICNQNNQLDKDVNLLEYELKKLDNNVEIKTIGDKNISRVKRNYLTELPILIGEMVFVMLVAILNVIYSSMYWIYNRRQEIAIRKTCGASDFDIFKMIYVEFVGIALFGSVIGLLIQGVLIKCFQVQLRLRNISIYVTWVNYMIALIVTLLSGLITSYLPVKLTIKMQPNEVLKG